MRRDSPRYGSFPKRRKSRERPWNRASPAFGKLWEHAGKCRVDLQKKGVHIVLASGRPEYGIWPIAKELELEKYGGYILAFNGGKIVECSTKKTIFERTIEYSYVQEIYEQVKDKKVALLTYENDSLITETPKDFYVEKESFINKMKIKGVEDFIQYISFPITKCLITGDGTYLERLEKKLQEYFKDELSIYRSEPFFLEIMPPLIDKAKSLEKLLRYLDCSRKEMVACGDGLNDLTMIEYAGIGVAMDNAQPVLKEKSDFVTLSNDQDGVAEAVKHFWKEIA